MASCTAGRVQGVRRVVTAVQDLDLEVRDQELVVLVGPSGCGKTTTLDLSPGWKIRSRSDLD